MFGAVVVKKGREVKQLTAVFDVYLNILLSPPPPVPLPVFALVPTFSSNSHRIKKGLLHRQARSEEHGCIHGLFSSSQVSLEKLRTKKECW